jgi:hypothetical protein
VADDENHGNSPPRLLTLHLSALRSEVENQLRRVVDAQRLWDRASRTEADMDEIVACLDGVLDANTAVGETCADARMEAINLTDVPAMEFTVAEPDTR